MSRGFERRATTVNSFGAPTMGFEPNSPYSVGRERRMVSAGTFMMASVDKHPITAKMSRLLNVGDSMGNVGAVVSRRRVV